MFASDSDCSLDGGVVAIQRHLVHLTLLGDQPKLRTTSATDMGSDRHLITGIAVVRPPVNVA